jgi:hypothetical protein
MLALPVAVLVVAGSVNAPIGTQALTLGELADKERERRKGVTARLYTEEDLRQVSLREGPAVIADTPETSLATPAAAGAPATADKAGDKAQKSEDELRGDREKAWRERLQKAKEDVTRLSADVDRLQLGLNDLTQNLYGQGRRAQIERLEETKGQLVTAQQSVEGIEEEGRRASFRP